MAWTVGILNETVRDEFMSLPKDMQARFGKIAELITEYGLNKVGMPHVRHLQDKLWEMRLKGKDGISRALYICASGERVVVVRIFIKKTQKTPPREIKIALQRAKEIEK